MRRGTLILVAGTTGLAGDRRIGADGTAVPGPAAGHDPAVASVRAVQGTVAEFDPGTHAGALLLDDGRRLAFGAAAFTRSGLRLLRPGQRVRVDLDRHGEPTRIRLVTTAGWV